MGVYARFFWVGLLALVLGHPGSAAEAPLADRYGDALPPGAVARLGTVRLRHIGQILTLAFSPDGKVLASGSDGGPRERSLCLWDAASGKLLVRCEGDGGLGLGLAFSPDGKRLASTDGGSVRLLDAATGKEVERLRRGGVGAPGLAFSPDGKVLAIADAHGVLLWDTATGEAHRLEVMKDASVTCLAFSPDGKALAAGGERGAVAVWDPAAGKELRRMAGPEGLDALAVAFSSDGKALTVAYHVLGRGSLDVWDLEKGEPLRRVSTKPDSYSCPRAISADGRAVTWFDNLDVARVEEAATGKELARLRLPPWHAAAAAFSPDGKVLATGSYQGICDQAVRLWDLATAKELLPAEGHTVPANRLTFSTDGNALASGGFPGKEVIVWDVAAAKERRRFPGAACAFAPDGTLATARSDQPLRLWDPRSGKELLRAETGEDIEALSFCADGKRLAGLAGPASAPFACVWDATSGKRLWRVQVELSYALGLKAVAPAPDGGMVATAEGAVVRLWDGATGKEVRMLGAETHSGLSSVAFSPDGRVVAAVGSRRLEGEPSPGYGVFRWEAATGKELPPLWASPPGDPDRPVVHSYPGGPLTFSPDGRLVAVAGRDPDVTVWEAATGRVRLRLRGHRGGTIAVAFAPDGRTLASGGTDTTVLLWDLLAPSQGKKRPAALSDEERARLWDSLGDPDAAKGYDALCLLAACPADAAALLGDRLRPVKIDADRVKRLLAGLDAETFEARERAEADLAALGQAAGPALRKALAGDPSAEAKRRLGRLLEALDGVPAGDRLRGLRAVEALERAGTKEARDLLDRLAAGDPAAELTAQARAALDRLTKSEHAKP
jgi:WD40 repeat protein